jgi:hypothetical protein
MVAVKPGKAPMAKPAIVAIKIYRIFLKVIIATRPSINIISPSIKNI